MIKCQRIEACAQARLDELWRFGLGAGDTDVTLKEQLALGKQFANRHHIATCDGPYDLLSGCRSHKMDMGSGIACWVLAFKLVSLYPTNLWITQFSIAAEVNRCAKAG